MEKKAVKVKFVGVAAMTSSFGMRDEEGRREGKDEAEESID